jgi:uncharacterized protein (DUF2235 family)
MFKNIVLLSDGTGNSSASPFKTNVWRLYQALDIADPANDAVPRQIVFYDDGVGTENIKPLAALGAAFGIGVWKNVRDLYTFVCRNYDIGDRIYGFGFSRGAFTIRLLMGLIGRCGVVKPTPDSEAKLLEAIEMAYEAYRRDFLIRASKQRGMIYHHILSGPQYHLDEAGNKTTKIKLPPPVETQIFGSIPFLGVWDTVDAYGMPVDELKLAIDGWVWPMSVADRDPSPSIDAIRHALSLDDERPTFRPVLWNEFVQDPDHPHDPTQRVALGQDRIQQVWFGGVHANVGGGYPDDGLAHVALDWMMSQAEVARLRFVTPTFQQISSRVDAHGEQHDSRAGLAGYYRYGPRSVKDLCDDDEHQVKVPTVRVHTAAFDRIALHQRAYAPVSLNLPFQLMGGSPQQYPPAEFLRPEADRLEQAWDIVWWRRLAYFATLALTAFMSLFALRLIFEWPDKILKYTEAVLSPAWEWITAHLGVAGASKIETAWHWLLDHAGAILPSWTTGLLPSFAIYPLSGVLGLALLALFFFKITTALQARIGAHAEWAWGEQKGLPAPSALQANWLNSVARVGRPVTAFLYRIWRKVLVNALGIAIGGVALILLSPFWLWRILRRPAWMRPEAVG